MTLRPHIHLLVPSSAPGIQLEARIYLESSPTLPPLTGTLRSKPRPYTSLVLSDGIDIDCLITAAHPWQKLGGLVDAAGAASGSTVVVTFNARGVGKSGGSSGLFGLNTVPNERDFGAVEEWAKAVFRPRRIKRVGYSWGSVAALNAPSNGDIHSTLLISPSSSIFTLTTPLFSSRSFSAALKDKTDVTVVHGTQDQFTSVSAFESLDKLGVKRRVVEGADHFYRADHAFQALEEVLKEWCNE